MKFADRGDAGRRLADKLAHLKNPQPVALALPRGGVAVGLRLPGRSLRCSISCGRSGSLGGPNWPSAR